MREDAEEEAPLPRFHLKLSGPAPVTMLDVLVMMNALAGRFWILLLMVKEALGTL